ncbi:hypothetical protein BJ508DRAFT_306307 [Ascobolus immersus RN42]|uniref:CCHC-type domain-containing protein n=1 Tax=Ascobolus immersus RN42 TaxID=1160509 RepID=A0A3N4I6J0_ASCIM|nr:hypothetical protein BJ508DRAFT_306307 [Ascobolus immersus RN42]
MTTPILLGSGKISGVPKLEAGNYFQWKEAVMIALSGINARQIVLGLETTPALNATTQYRDFISRSEHGAALLHRTCGPTAASLISGNFDPVDIWTTLEARFKATETSRLQLIQRFHNLRYNPETMKCAADYIAQLRAIQAELKGSEDALTDRNLLAHLLTHLPGRYRITQKHPKGRKHRSRSRDAERRRSRSPRNSSYHQSRWNQNDRHSRPWRKETDKRDSNYSAKECTYCHRRGHLAHECRKRIYDERNKQSKHRETTDPSGSGSDTTITAGSASVKAGAVIDDYFAESDRTERRGFGKQH